MSKTRADRLGLLIEARLAARYASAVTVELMNRGEGVTFFTRCELGRDQDQSGPRVFCSRRVISPIRRKRRRLSW